MSPKHLAIAYTQSYNTYFNFWLIPSLSTCIKNMNIIVPSPEYLTFLKKVKDIRSNSNNFKKHNKSTNNKSASIFCLELNLILPKMHHEHQNSHLAHFVSYSHNHQSRLT